MADYVSILNKAIGGLGDNNADNRQAIYQKARGAIDRKLRSMDPAPSEDAIAGQLAQLEEAINQVEGEQQLAAIATNASEPVTAEPVPEPPAAPSAPPAPVTSQETAVEPVPAADAAVPSPNPPAGFVDDVILIDGIGEKTREALEGEGVVGISQVAAMSDAQLAAVTERIGYPGFEQTQEWKKQATEMLGGTLPRSKTDQERLKKLQSEQGAVSAEAEASPPSQAAETPAPEAPAVTPLAPPTPAPTPEPTPVTPSEPAVEPTPIVPEAGDAEPAASETAPPQSAPQPSVPPVAEPQPPVEAQTPAPSAPTADSPAEPADDQKAFADAIAELTKGRSADAASAVPAAAAAPVADASIPGEPGLSAPEPTPEPPQAGTTSGAELRPSIDTPLAGSSDAPPYVGQIDEDPFAARPDGRSMADGDIGAANTVLKPRRSFGKTLGCAGLLALLGGVAYGGWVYQDQVKEYGSKAMETVQALFGGAADSTEPDAPAPETDAPATDTNDNDAQATDEKDDSRLGSDATQTEDNNADDAAQANGGEESQADDGDAPRNILAEPVQETPATVEVEGQDDPIAGEATDDSAAPSDENAGADSDTSADGATDQTAQNETTTEETTTPVVEPAIAAGESAFLYEEAVGATGANRDEGGVVWTLAQEAPEAGAEPEAVIKGLVEIPARGLKLNLSIKRNVDPGLPASHIIELLFTAPPDFSGGNIDNVSRFVMKANEQARGESLVGVPARIDAGFFLIALNNLEQAQQTNVRLLENGAWIDIPVAYVTGRRGLVTLSKGETGNKVFADAFADWRNR